MERTKIESLTQDTKAKNKRDVPIHPGHTKKKNPRVSLYEKSSDAENLRMPLISFAFLY